jgi:hypothetical protein
MKTVGGQRFSDFETDARTGAGHQDGLLGGVVVRGKRLNQETESNDGGSDWE